MLLGRFPLGVKMGLMASLILSPIALFLVSCLLIPATKPFPLFLFILSTLILMVAVFLALTWWFVDRPIKRLMEAMTLTEEKSFLARVPVKSEDTVGQLSRSFNRLLEKITTLDASQLETSRELTTAQGELKMKHDLEARWKELSLLYDFSKKMTATLELDELYNIFDDFFGERLGLDEAALLVWDEAREELVVKVARGFADQSKVQGMGFKAGEGITGRVMERKETIYIPDTRNEKNYLYYKGEKREDVSFLSVPLIFREKVVGVLNVTRPGVDKFSSEEIRFFNTIAAEAAIALSNGKLYQRTRELSVRDELTQLYNRRHFQEILALEIKRAKRFNREVSLIMIDLDHFKSYNDQHGHRQGDSLLREFSNVVGQRIREIDFFARFGGEEFVLVLPSTSKSDALTVGEKLLHAVRDHNFPEGGLQPNGRITASFGIASYPPDADSMEELIDHADEALYEAKRTGRDRIVVFECKSSPTH